MRKLIGHAPIIICGVSVIVVNNEGQLLLQKRRDNGCWGYHGGCMEIDETTEETTKRELLEETGLVADKLELFGVFSGPDMHYTYPNEDEVSIIDIVYVCNKWTGKINKDTDEVSELRFFELDDLPDNFSPPIKRSLYEYVRKCCS
jgi:ADP-ribose pyrophosphatase YjhB (NUDIX family)